MKSVDQFLSKSDNNKKITLQVPRKLLAIYVFIGARDVLKESWGQKLNTYFMANTLFS